MQTVSAYIGIGSNQGNRLANLSEAVYLLGSTPGIGIIALSSAYESAPKDMPAGSRDFLNAVAKIETVISPADLLATCLGIERIMGRDRSWVVQDRPIDLDLLYYEGAAMRTTELVLPHPRAHIRTFVLIPWVEIAPHISLYGATISDWLKMLPPEEYVRCELLGKIPDYDSIA